VDLVKLLSSTSSGTAAFDLVDSYLQTFQKVQQTLKQSNLTYKAVVDRHQKHKVFGVGDQVMIYLQKERLPAGVHGKLRQKSYGPSKVLKRINANAYMIDLPDNMNISKTFNVTDFSTYHPEANLFDHSGVSFFFKWRRMIGNHKIMKSCSQLKNCRKMKRCNHIKQIKSILKPTIINEVFRDFKSDL
jgi:hypothetical protein